MALLQNEKVQKEIDLLADQKKDLDRLADEASDRRRGGPEFNFREASQEEREKYFREAAERREAATKETVKKVEEILLPPQVSRLKEISLQVRGTRALSDPQVVKELGITQEQQDQLAKVGEEARERGRGLYEGINFRESSEQEREAIRAKGEALRKESNEKTLAVLNAGQREKLEKLKGKPVSFDIAEVQRGMFNFGGRGGPGAPGGGQGRPGGDGTPRRRGNDN
jgi:hypothetical protein